MGIGLSQLGRPRPHLAGGGSPRYPRGGRAAEDQQDQWFDGCDWAQGGVGALACRDSPDGVKRRLFKLWSRAGMLLPCTACSPLGTHRNHVDPRTTHGNHHQRRSIVTTGKSSRHNVSRTAEYPSGASTLPCLMTWDSPVLVSTLTWRTANNNGCHGTNGTVYASRASLVAIDVRVDLADPVWSLPVSIPQSCATNRNPTQDGYKTCHCRPSLPCPMTCRPPKTCRVHRQAPASTLFPTIHLDFWPYCRDSNWMAAPWTGGVDTLRPPLARRFRPRLFISYLSLLHQSGGQRAPPPNELKTTHNCKCCLIW